MVDQLNVRCNIQGTQQLKRRIIEQLQAFFHANNANANAVLQLKVGTVIMILRNLNPPRLCNGTRLSVKRLMPNLIEAIIINGKYAGENVCIPRIPMIPTDLPFDFKRLQFPVRLAFAMTINKSQGQSLSVCGINLENHCFSHGQLYVACSRVGKPSALFVLTSDQKTKNVVYQRALQ